MKTLSKALLVILSVILAILLAVTSLCAATIYTVRSNYTPEYVYNFMNSLDYANLEIPDGNGGFGTVCELANSSVAELGIKFTDRDIDSLIHSFSIDAILTSFVQELRSWALDNGAVPTLDGAEMAETILSGADQNMLMFLSMFGDVEGMLTNALSNISESSNLTETLEKAEPVRELLSQGTLMFVLSICGTLILLIFVTRQLKLTASAVFCGSAWIVSGCVMLFCDKILAPVKAVIIAQFPETTLDLVYRPLIEMLHQTGTFLSLGGLAIVVVFAVIGALFGMVKREKERAAIPKA